MNNGSEGQETTQQVDSSPVEATETPVQTSTEGNDPGGHPAWESLYGAVSEDMVPILKPHLDEADRNVQKRFEALNEKYSPWDEVIKSVDPDYATKAVTYAQFLEQNPQAVYEALKQRLGITDSPAPVEEETPADPVIEGLDPDDPLAQQLIELKKQNSQFEAFIQAQQQAQQYTLAQQEEARARQVFEDTMSGLKEQHGDFDEIVVTAYLAAGFNPDQAMAAYIERFGTPARNTNSTNSAPPPPVSGGSGGLPADNTLNPGKMASQEVEDLVAKMLDQAQG